MKIFSKYKYKYIYVSPFGECWIVYRLLFGFIPIKYREFDYKVIDGKENEDEVERYVKALNL
jgi:hypothetical protein